MIIGIDGNEANVTERVGVSEFAYELLTEFVRLSANDKKFEVFLKNKPVEDFPNTSKLMKYRVFGPKKLWTQFALPVHLFFQRPKSDVFFSPSHYAPRFSPCPTVISIMDVAYSHFPQLFAKKDLYQLEQWTKYSVKKAKKIITISEASKRDILKLYNLPQDRISVVYPGIKFMQDLTPHVYPIQELQRKYGINEHYLLFVGTLQPRKNITRLIEAFSNLEETKNHSLQLVIIGKKGWLYEEILAAPKKFAIEKDVKFLDFVPNEDLPLFYKHAKCFVWPCLYEGFGLPILEAMKYDCPVITSNVSSMPEAGGDAALYVTPTDTQDIIKKIKMVLEDGELRKSMIEKGRKQVKKFSWEKAAQETIKILEEVGGTHER